ncbi:MAG: malto-oligosyltrehalose trehalohydrolase, partial [Actinomycetota bacterium]|nr:malto-oligosyltrehalose trehalohydrolase [Actinomycetota bacterium]
MTFVASGLDRTTFDVWAPKADRLTLLLNGERYPMQRLDDGWWAPEDEALLMSADQDYGYLLDDEETPVPDPRSRRQP